MFFGWQRVLHRRKTVGFDPIEEPLEKRAVWIHDGRARVSVEIVREEVGERVGGRGVVKHVARDHPVHRR
jgi:hypothetical protein